MRLLLLIALLAVAMGLDNGLGKTPPMGWNSWNKFHCDINETLIKETADLLVSTGLAAKGYKYVNLDDCWQIDRNTTTKEIIEDKTKFPSGMGALGEYVHSKGLLYGLYSCAGFKTCQGRPGSLGF
jgi:alpha-galactosidase